MFCAAARCMALGRKISTSKPSGSIANACEAEPSSTALMRTILVLVNMVANPFWARGEPSWLTDAHNLGFVTGTRSAKTHIAKRARLKHLDFKFDLVVTAERVGAYKPETPSRFLYARVTWRSGN